MDRNKVKGVMKITLSLPTDVHDELRRRAKLEGVKGALSLITARALREYFENHPTDK